MPPQAYLIGAALVWNVARDQRDESTICQWLRTHPFATTAALAWFLPHLYRGTHMTDRIIRALDGLR